jgi:hypothetical protein
VSARIFPESEGFMSNRNSFMIFVAMSLLLLCLTYSPVYAAWSNDPAVNTPVSTATGNQNDQRIHVDDNGGVIIIWTDYRSGTATVYAQKLDAKGVPQWAADGVAVCTATGAQENPRLHKDDSGGAIIVWQDYRSASNYDIYAQRIDSNGNRLWGDSGVAVCTAGKSQKKPLIQRDGSGGAIITWHDNRNSSSTGLDIYAQRLNANGVPQWTADGVAVCTATGDQQNPEMDRGDDGSAFIVWQDYRNGADWNIYAQKLDANGVPQWTGNGVSVTSAAGDQYWQRIVMDDNGDPIISWQDYRSGNADIYAQKLAAANGAAQWNDNGALICSAANDQTHPNLRPFWGGAIIMWQDYRSGSNWDIYAQRIDANGTVQWTANGVAISTASHDQINPSVREDDFGRAVITWEDFRAGGTYADVYAQRVDASGNTLWSANGVAITTSGSVDTEFWPMLRITSNDQSAVITWSDVRSGVTDANIYAQKIQSNGTLPCPDGPIKIQGTSNYYTSIQTAYNTADGQTVQIESIEFTEDLTLNSGKIVKLRGGYYGCGFSTLNGSTTVHGKVTIKSGTVTMDNLIIM